MEETWAPADVRAAWEGLAEVARGRRGQECHGVGAVRPAPGFARGHAPGVLPGHPIAAAGAIMSVRPWKLRGNTENQRSPATGSPAIFLFRALRQRRCRRGPSRRGGPEWIVVPRRK
jgi:hypothetical protein